MEKKGVVDPDDLTLPVGWTCEQCGRSIAPFMSICPYCAETAQEINDRLEKDGYLKIVHGGKEDGGGMIKESSID